MMEEKFFIRLDTWDDWVTYLLMISDLECCFSKRFKEFRAKRWSNYFLEPQNNLSFFQKVCYNEDKYNVAPLVGAWIETNGDKAVQ